MSNSLCLCTESGLSTKALVDQRPEAFAGTYFSQESLLRVPKTSTIRVAFARDILQKAGECAKVWSLTSILYVMFCIFSFMVAPKSIF